MLIANKDVPFKDLDDAMFHSFGPNTGLSPGAMQRIFWFINNVHAADWHTVSEGKNTVWIPIGNNKNVGIRSKNEKVNTMNLSIQPKPTEFRGLQVGHYALDSVWAPLGEHICHKACGCCPL